MIKKSGKKILIVDNMEYIRTILKARFKASGITIIEGTNGLEAIEKAIKERPDLILLDVMMPKMNGFDVCKELKSNPLTCSIPVVMLTARGEQTDIKRGEELGVVKYVTKPFSPKQLASEVIELIEKN